MLFIHRLDPKLGLDRTSFRATQSPFSVCNKLFPVLLPPDTYTDILVLEWVVNPFSFGQK